MRFIFSAGSFLIFFGCLINYAVAGSIEGKIVSLDRDGQALTLETGEVLVATANFSIDVFDPGQIVRIYYDDETGSITSISVLQAADAVDKNLAEPPTETSSLPE